MTDHTNPDDTTDETNENMNDETNENSPTADDTTTDRVGSQLDTAAASVDTGDLATMLASVHAVAGKRRRRRAAVIGVAAAGMLVMSGVVVANLVSSDGDELFVSTPATDVETDSSVDPVATEPPITAPAEASTDPVTENATPVRVVPGNGQTVADAGVEAEPGVRLFPWNGGFLAVRTVYGDQPLPEELPQEVIDLFPPEVVEFFDGELPPTIEEATAMLEEAGLYDTVAEIVTDNPEAYDAIFSQGSAPATTTVRFSPDGVEWTDIETEFPVESIGQASVSDDRFVLVDEQFDAADDVTGVEMYSSTDLVNWTSQTIPAATRPVDLPDYARFSTYVESLLASNDGVLVSTYASTYVDVESLLAPELQTRLRESTGGYGSSYDDEGVTVDVYEPERGETEEDSFDEPSETLRFTWEELGVEALPSSVDESGSTTSWFVPWDGEPTTLSSPDGQDVGYFGQIAAFDGGFVEFFDGISISTGGVEWTPVTLPVDGFVESVLPVGGAVIVFLRDEAGEASQFRLDPETATWSPIEIPGLPDGSSVQAIGDGVARIEVYDESQNPYSNLDVGGSRSSAEVDGYLFELDVLYGSGSGRGGGGETISYAVTDTATGEIVVTESAALSEYGDEGEDPFEFLDEGADGTDSVVVFDPDTGDELAVLDFERADTLFLGADGEPLADQPTEEEMSYDPGQPESWILATDGESWIVEQVADGGDEYTGWWGDAVVQNGVLLVARESGDFIRYEFG